jgi:hypothetical protein
VDPFGFLDDLFGGNGGGGYSTTKGGAPLNQGFSAFQGWAVGQAFSNAGPIGQYLGLLYGSPGTGISNVAWETQQEQRSSGGGAGSSGSGTSSSGSGARSSGSGTSSSGNGDGDTGGGSLSSDATLAPIDSNLTPPAGARSLEHLDREGSAPSDTDGEQIQTVNVFGAPPDRPRARDSFEDFLQRFRDGSYYQGSTFSGPERQIVLPDQPPPRPPRPRQSTVRKPPPADPIIPTVQPPDPNPVDGGPYFEVPVQTPSTVPNPAPPAVPWMSDAAPPPEKFLPWGAWDRPERQSSWEPERMSSFRGDAGRIETAPTITPERTFWDRGGTGLAAGAFTAAVGVGIVMFWNPVGWAAIGAALAIAGGVAATTASAVELSASYGGVTSAEQDSRMNRAVSATLGFSSPGGALGSVIGTVLSDDPEQGFEIGAFWGGTLEAGWGIAASLPGALRALPGISRAALPWAKSLLLEPLWFSMSARGGGGNARSLARVFAAQGRLASRVRSVEYLGTTPLLEREAEWAQFQVFATRSRNESIFRITFANGRQRIALSDGFDWGSLTNQEAKLGDMGQMFNRTRQAHIMRQADNNVIISNATGGSARYMVSTELGASRLTQRFTLDFPSEMASGQLQVDWVQWRR